jgi:PAS domain S-box-containing protein
VFSRLAEEQPRPIVAFPDAHADPSAPPVGPTEHETLLDPFTADNTLEAVVDTNYRIVQINELIARSLGQRQEDLVGRCLICQFSELDRQVRHEVLERCRLTRQPVRDRVVSALGLGQIEVLVFPMLNARGGLEHFATFGFVRE